AARVLRACQRVTHNTVRAPVCAVLACAQRREEYRTPQQGASNRSHESRHAVLLSRGSLSDFIPALTEPPLFLHDAEFEAPYSTRSQSQIHWSVTLMRQQKLPVHERTLHCTPSGQPPARLPPARAVTGAAI